MLPHRQPSSSSISPLKSNDDSIRPFSEDDRKSTSLTVPSVEPTFPHDQRTSSASGLIDDKISALSSLDSQTQAREDRIQAYDGSRVETVGKDGILVHRSGPKTLQRRVFRVRIVTISQGC